MDPHPLLRDLAPRNAAEQERPAEVERALGGELLVHRRSLPVLTTQFAESLPPWAAGLRVESAVGPIRDRFGRDVWFDLFRRVRQVRFVRSAGAAPFLALPVQQFTFTSPGTHTTFQLGAGSFWIATRLLAAAAVGDIYTGLRIKGGTLRFGQPVEVSADEVVVPAAVTCEVTLTLDPPAQPPGHGPGRDVREALFQPPREVTFRISGASATVTLGTTAALAIYDERVDLDPISGAPAYLPIFNRVRAPLAPQTADFVVRNVQSASFRPDGSAPIAGAGWALPAARIGSADLGEAAGVGALMLELHAGLSATWTGQADLVALGPTIIFLDEARLATVSAAAQGYSVAQKPQLPHPITRGGVALTWARTFPRSYFAQAAGSEAVFTAAAFAASFEKPVDVSGERVAQLPRRGDPSRQPPLARTSRRATRL
jgi:hypothetical protein